MKHLSFFALISVFLLFGQNGYCSSLDELYRDVIRSDNQGYLPLFVKNRNTPDFNWLDEENFKNLPEDKISPLKDAHDPMRLSREYTNPSVLEKSKQQQWLKTIAAIKANQVTPLELNEITSRVKENDPKATEILAWMYTKGVGVSKDFVTAFNLYKKAATLNVTDAEKNAVIVYKSMSEEQKQKLLH